MNHRKMRRAVALCALWAGACLSGGCLSGDGGSGGGTASVLGSGGSSTQAGSGGTSESGSGGTSTSGSGGESASTAGPPPFEPAWQACETPADCIFLRSQGCCGCTLVGVNAQFEKEAMASLVPQNLSDCGPVGCANQDCAPDPIAACSAGMCQALPGCSSRPVADCETDGQCQVYTAKNCQRLTDEFAPMICGMPHGSSSCDPVPTCRVMAAAGLMILFQDACVPPVGFEQDCNASCP